MTCGGWGEARCPLLDGWVVGDSPSEGRRYSAAMLRPLTGFEEDWLAEQASAPSAIATSRILDACVLRIDDEPPPRGFSRRMLVGDRDYLIVQIRRLTLGDQVMAVVDCPGCRAKMDVDFDASAIPVQCPAQTHELHEISLPARGGHPDRTARFRLPVGSDQEAVLGRDVDAACDEILRRCVSDAGGVPLSENEKALLIAAMEERAPRVELELQLTCPECSQSFVLPFDTTAFFLEEMRIASDQLLREVHSLALYYHWTESEILGLARHRRRAYLALLSDALRQ
jgi:hypothetical protein